MPSRIRKSSFVAQFPDGRDVIVYVLEQVEDTSTLDAAASLLIGQSFRTADGRPVNRISKGKYEVLTSAGAVAISSSDGNAP